MQTRSLSTEDYEWITDVGFEKTEDLYDYYLQVSMTFFLMGLPAHHCHFSRQGLPMAAAINVFLLIRRRYMTINEK